MSNPVCPIHSLESAVKDSVPNKNTGGFYPPFYGCPFTEFDVMTGKKVYCKHRFTEKPTVTSIASGIQANAVATGANKDQAIKHMNALKIASELMAAGTIPTGPDWKETFEAVTEYVYFLKPPPEKTQ